ncbi:MAG: hypothetical protein V7751_07545 [Pseudoalteromonas distincta]
MANTTLTVNQTAFSSYLAELWGCSEKSVSLSPAFPGYETGLLHSYPITKAHHWNGWKARHSKSVGHWWCRSLQEAADNYSWPESSEGRSFAELSGALRQALTDRDDTRAHQMCLAIFSWGGVARRSTDKSRVWVDQQLQHGTLCESLLTAVKLLAPDVSHCLDSFDGQTLLMNSAMTKVYAAADPANIIIYDGRVGGALGMLTLYWLEGQAKHSMPPDMAFPWGNGAGKSSRNPSQGHMIFPKFDYSPSRTVLRNRTWASWVRTASGIFQHMRSINPNIKSLGQIEQAMFMIGYRVQFEAPASPQAK